MTFVKSELSWLLSPSRSTFSGAKQAASWFGYHTTGDSFQQWPNSEVTLPTGNVMASGSSHARSRTKGGTQIWECTGSCMQPSEDGVATGGTEREAIFRDMSNPWQAFRGALWRRVGRSCTVGDKRLGYWMGTAEILQITSETSQPRCWEASYPQEKNTVKDSKHGKQSPEIKRKP